jgi:hypothetical protein
MGAIRKERSIWLAVGGIIGHHLNKGMVGATLAGTCQFADATRSPAARILSFCWTVHYRVATQNGCLFPVILHDLPVKNNREPDIAAFNREPNVSQIAQTCTTHDANIEAELGV